MEADVVTRLIREAFARLARNVTGRSNCSTGYFPACSKPVSTFTTLMPISPTA